MREQESNAAGSTIESVTVPEGVRLRVHRPAEIGGILDLLARSWPADAVSEAWFTNYVLLDPRFDADGLLVAERDGRLVGTIHAVAATESGQGVVAGSGWVPLFAVDPSSRNAGIGSALLEAATAFLRDAGMSSVTVGAYPPAYVIPGIDLESGEESRRLLESAGFEVVEEPVGMRIDLRAQRPDGAQDALERATALGFRFRPCSAGDLPALLGFAATIGADWGDVIRDSVVRHGDAARFQLAFSPSGGIAGFAAFGSYEGDLSRFGPFGVDPAHRGVSLGRILLEQTLQAMRARGAGEAWFLWTDLHGPAGRLYQRAGFTPFRRFAILRKPLA